MSAARPLHIEELHLSGFRAFAKARLQLGEITVLVGRNGAGKSTLVDALEFLREALTDSLEAALERRGGLEALLHRGPRESSHLSVALGARLSTAYLREVRRTTGLPLPLPRSRAGVTVTYGFRVVPARGRARFSVDSEVSQAMGWGFHRSGSPRGMCGGARYLLTSGHPRVAPCCCRLRPSMTDYTERCWMR